MNEKTSCYTILLGVLFCLFGIACTPQPDWELTGAIGKTVEGKIALFQAGDSVKGTFTNLATGDEITLRGEIDGGKILLKEFAGGEAIAGFFEGKWRSPIYSGNWVSSNRSQQVPFAFYAEDLMPSAGEERSKAGIQMAYDYWYYSQLNDEHCSESDCFGVFEELKQGLGMSCFIGIADSGSIVYGDFNGDGLLDAVAHTNMIQCGGGGALNHALWRLAIMSEAPYKYQAIEDWGLDEYSVWGAGGSVDSISNQVIYGHGLDYGPDDGRCCPSIVSEVEIVYKDKHFVRIK